MIEFDWRDAARVIEERGWIQSAMESEHGVCLTGAIKACEKVPGDWLIARAVARHRKHGEEWNDATRRTKDQVLRWLSQAKTIEEAELAVVFGPQWREIVAHVRRSEVLTAHDAHRLRTVEWTSCASQPAWQAAENDGGTRRVQLMTAWEATDGMPLSLSWVRQAALMLSARDLIGQSGFTQGIYDSLTMPWRTVIGKLHEDDAEVGSEK